jgi:poly(3-hydroxybutyrate) depolymerase
MPFRVAHAVSNLEWLIGLGLCLVAGCGKATVARDAGAGAQSVRHAKQERLGVAALLTCLEAPPNAIYRPEALAPRAAPGVEVFTFDQQTQNCGSVTRRYLVHVPKSVTLVTTAPVVIGLPGRGANAEALREFQAKGVFDQLADRDGFIMVYGNGLPTPNNLDGLANSGEFRSEYTQLADEVDDLEYLQRIVDDLKARHLIGGNNPIYLVGHSNGGGLALSATRQHPERYAGVAAFMPFVGFVPDAPKDLRSTKLARVMFVLSLTDPAFLADYAKSVQLPLAQAYGRALGIEPPVLAAPTSTAIADSVQEGADYTGSNPTITATRQSSALRLDSASAHGRLRVLQFDHAGHFWPTVKHDDPISILQQYGLRNQDIDGSRRSVAVLPRVAGVRRARLTPWAMPVDAAQS